MEVSQPAWVHEAPAFSGGVYGAVIPVEAAASSLERNTTGVSTTRKGAAVIIHKPLRTKYLRLEICLLCGECCVCSVMKTCQ